MKILFVGDIHTHDYILDDIKRLDKKYKFNKIVLFGDYVDDWLSSGYDSIETLNKIIELKNSNNKYTLLLGNHELSYLGFPCSGHQYSQEKEIENILLKNIDLFDFYTSVQCGDKKYYCSHAGFTNEYLENVFNQNDYDDINYEEHLQKINKNKLNNLFLASLCSYMRGGSNNCSSFLWADRKEHLYFNENEEPIIPYQIIGHTPVTHIDLNNDFIFIDTHSTYRDGTPFGDKSYLGWINNKFVILN